MPQKKNFVSRLRESLEGYRAFNSNTHRRERVAAHITETCRRIKNLFDTVDTVKAPDLEEMMPKVSLIKSYRKASEKGYLTA
jgi:hypothetical protein